jgi:transcriptional regulator with XRE-family HTH domain
VASKRALQQVQLLSELRSMCGKNQQDLAALMGVTQSAISKLERREDPSLNDLRNFVGALRGEVFVEIRFAHGSVEFVGVEEGPPTSR